jgi:hypothetical protein
MVLFAGAEGHRHPFRGHAFTKLNNNHIHIRSNVNIEISLSIRCCSVELQALSEAGGSGAAKFLNDHGR